MRPKFSLLIPIALLVFSARAQTPVYQTTRNLADLLAQTPADSLEVFNQSVKVKLIEGLGGNISTHDPFLIPPTGIIPLESYGLYQITALEIKAWHGPQQLRKKSYQPILLENAPYWIRLVEKNGNPPEGTILWKEDLLAITAHIAVMSGLIQATDTLKYTDQWFELIKKIDDNSFFHHQLASLELSTIPTSHPLIPELLTHFNTALSSITDTPTPARPTTSPRRATEDYFSLEDLTNTYQSDVADGTIDLRQAEQRLRSNTPPTAFNTATIVAGLTDFVLARAKEEFSITFLEGFQRNLNPTDSKFGMQELAILFPNTAQFFKEKSTVSDFKNFLPTVRGFFVRDLQSMGLQIHRLLETEPYAHLRNSNHIYNIALFYDIASMTIQGVAPDTLLQNLSSRLTQRQQQLFLQVNRDLAQSTPARPSIDSLRYLVLGLNHDLDTLEKAILKINSHIENNLLPELLLVTESKDSVLFSNRDFRQSFDDYWDKIERSSQRLANWTIKNSQNQLYNIPSLLSGQRYYQPMADDSRLERYEEFFGSQPDSIQLVASGIDLSKRLITASDGTPPITTFLMQYYRDVSGIEQRLQEKVDFVRSRGSAALKQQQKKLEEARQTFSQQLDREIAFWESQPAFLLDDLEALKFIRRALDALRITTPSQQPDYATLQYQQNQLNQAKDWTKQRILPAQKRLNVVSPGLPSIQETSVLETTSGLNLDHSGIEATWQRIARRCDTLQCLLVRMDTGYVGVPAHALEQAALLGSVVDMASQLLSCLQVSEPGEAVHYISPDQFWALMRDEQQRDVFLGIVQQRLEVVSRQSRLSSRNVARITTRLADLVFNGYTIRDSLRHIPQDQLRFSDYLPIVRVGADIISTFIEHPMVEQHESMPSLHAFASVNQYLLSLFEDIQAKRYGNAIQQLIQLFQVVVAPSQPASERWNQVTNTLVRYGGFMANVATAQTPEDMKGALLAAALPPGSSRIKRESSFNLGLNTYLGLSLGRERLEATGTGAYSVGLSLPVGISTSWRVSKERSSSMSFLLSVLDLGTMATFRLGDSQAELLPEVRWDNFIAPGGYLLYNFPKSPFSLGAGAQYGPRTRAITAANGVETSTPAWRYGLFFGIDVPVFSFATRPSKWQKKRSSRSS